MDFLSFLFNRKKDLKNATKKRVAIFGGSFDPVHKGHIEIARKLLSRFDRVVVVPAKISPFKLDRETADSADRLSMLKLAFSDIEGLEISDFEIRSTAISYSYLTARHFAADDVLLSYVIGSEMLSSLSKWKNFDELKKLTSFYVVKRDGYEIDPELIGELERLGARIRLADFECEDISSAMIKVDIAFKLPSIQLDERVLDYINRHNLYSDYSYITDRFSEFSLKQERIEHTYRAVKVGIRLAKIHGVDVTRVITALLLHDIGKYTTIRELLKKRPNLKISIDSDMPDSCMHAAVGAVIAREFFGVLDEGIILSIKSHTSGAPFMDDLAKIVAIADYIEDGRDFDGLEKIRAAAYKDLDLCMELVLKNTIEHLKGKNIYKATFDALDYFRMINSRKNQSN